MKVTVCFLLLIFFYSRGLGTCDASSIVSPLTGCFGEGHEEKLAQVDFSAAFDKVSHRGVLYKLRSIDVERQFLPIVSEFLCDRWQRVRLDDKVSALVGVVSRVPQYSVLGSLLSILYTCKFFVRNHILGYADYRYCDPCIYS